MLAMVLSSTTISWATQMRTSAQAACRGAATAPSSTVDSSRAVRSVMGCLSVGGSDGSAHSASGRQDDLVDDAGDELLGGELADEDEAVHDDPGQGRGEQVDVDLGADLATGDGPLEDG